ncbi:MAG TPA: MBL fold metallo-hydrolase [Allosphingosinicella sp.]|jgi:competence protein ComEC|uniref:MBL fold metallo-hydrolase n=1 Tax=Allosphingosinicella sp. TaxID=2823234 RepID=UPI002F2A45A0
MSISTLLMGLFRSLLLLVAIGSSTAVAAPQVQPSERVETRVIVRSAPSSEADRLGQLEPGESAELVGDAPGWHQVRLPDGRIGYVSKAWTDILELVLDAAYTMHVIDVGTGLAIFVEGPDFTLLYDAGSNDDTDTGSPNRVLAYLRKVRPDLRSIDHVVLSHAHKDHLHLLPDIFDSYEIRHVWDSGRLFDRCGYRNFLQKVAAETGAQYHSGWGSGGTHTFRFERCRSGANAVTLQLESQLQRGPVNLGQGARMDFLYVDTEPHHDPNENSLVVRLDLGTRRILLTGDAEGGRRDLWPGTPTADSVEGKLLACCRAALAADLLVSGHHGSTTSSRSDFLDAVGARAFVISSGPYRYSGTSLPDAAVVQEYRRRGALWQTDYNDAACKVDRAKIGTDADGEAGGCDNIRAVISSSGQMQLSYHRVSD